MGLRTVSNLTPKQRETVELLAVGYSSKHIAAQFGISPQGVDRRIQGLLRKTGCADRRALVRWHVQRSGLSLPSEINLGRAPDEDPSSRTERITAGLDQSTAPPPQAPIQSNVRSDPEAHSSRARSITRIEWLGMEVTWLQAILMLMALREAYALFG
jgi:DNA-binding CsgD family transcriptional regulator